MRESAVIFDFNGTLFWDSKYQELSWLDYLEKHNIDLSQEEINLYIHGRNAKDTFEYIFKKEFSGEEIMQLVEEKEILYRAECSKHSIKLAPGAVDLLEYLTNNKIPTAIATASGKTNVDFFIEKFQLLKYFDRKHIIYDDGNIRGKPDPDLFLKAINILSVNPQDTTIFEDSVSGIEAAKKCKVKNVVLVNSMNDKIDNELVTIKNFYEFNRELL